MARLQCSECGYDEHFGIEIKENSIWFDEEAQERITYEEARDRSRLKGPDGLLNSIIGGDGVPKTRETSKLYLTTKLDVCDCPGEVKFNLEGNRPHDYPWGQLNGHWPPHGGESPF